MIRTTSIVICLIVLCSSELAIGVENESYVMSTQINASNIEMVSFVDNITGNFSRSELATIADELLNGSEYSAIKAPSACTVFDKMCHKPFNPEGPCAGFKRCMRGYICESVYADCFCGKEHPNDEAAFEKCVEENTGECDCEPPVGC
jgi:hypothetical protein